MNVLPKEPLKIYNTSNVLVLLSFISPLILSISIICLSLIFQNFKGFIYLGFLIGVCLLREFLFANVSKYEKFTNDGTVCSSFQFSNTGNNTFSIFVSCFTFMYLCVPMFMNNSINWVVFSAFLLFISTDIFIKTYEKCIQFSRNGVQLFVDILFGLSMASVITSLMYMGGSGKYLFFNETSSTKEVCSMAKKQTFKCAVYKNGELISSSTSAS
jgi:hypothetical protein